MPIRQWTLFMLAAVIILIIGGCTPGKPAAEKSGLSAAFDPENPLEYGMSGIYLDQGIAGAMNVLQPKQYEFMDAVSRQSLTVEQLAKGEGTVATGIVQLDHSQLLLKVRNGVITSIIMGGAPEAEGEKYRTNRGVPLYAPVEQVKEKYGDTADGKELIYKGSKYQMLFSIHNGKVIGFRFDTIQ
jgi:hypothetical protein